jgi:hypothetical protein
VHFSELLCRFAKNEIVLFWEGKRGKSLLSKWGSFCYVKKSVPEKEKTSGYFQERGFFSQQ